MVLKHLDLIFTFILSSTNKNAHLRTVPWGLYKHAAGLPSPFFPYFLPLLSFLFFFGHNRKFLAWRSVWFDQHSRSILEIEYPSWTVCKNSPKHTKAVEEKYNPALFSLPASRRFKVFYLFKAHLHTKKGQFSCSFLHFHSFSTQVNTCRFPVMDISRNSAVWMSKKGIKINTLDLILYTWIIVIKTKLV